METKASGLDCAKIFQLYEEARADNTAHLRKIIELEKRVEELETNRIHTCHDQCPKIECVQRRRIEELEAENKNLREVLHWIKSDIMFDRLEDPIVRKIDEALGEGKK